MIFVYFGKNGVSCTVKFSYYVLMMAHHVLPYKNDNMWHPWTAKNKN